MIGYGFTKALDVPFDKAVDAVTSALKKEGFGVLTKIDVRDKFKEKLGINFKKYLILGACNPSSAHEAILAEEDIGLFLPCNVIVYEKGDRTQVSVIKPKAAMAMIDNDRLKEIAERVEIRLQKVFDSI